MSGQVSRGEEQAERHEERLQAIYLSFRAPSASVRMYAEEAGLGQSLLSFAIRKQSGKVRCGVWRT